MNKIDYDVLGYLTAHELWEVMRDLKIPYCNIEEIEKENLSTGEKVIIPKFVPRTDFENMKSDIIVRLNELNREQKRPILLRIRKLTTPRMKRHQQEVKDNG